MYSYVSCLCGYAVLSVNKLLCSYLKSSFKEKPSVTLLPSSAAVCLSQSIKKKTCLCVRNPFDHITVPETILLCIIIVYYIYTVNNNLFSLLNSVLQTRALN